MSHGGPRRGAPRRVARRLTLGIGGALAVSGFTALGTWQVERRTWKHALIAQAQANLRAPPIEAPFGGDPQLRPVDAGRGRSAQGGDRLHGPVVALSPRRAGPGDVYRRIVLRGRYLPARAARVHAVTARGGGFWLLVPFVEDGGGTILVNRGFVGTEATAPLPSSAHVVTGLVRLSEPGGGFLRRNDPAADRWYSRDTTAIAAARGWGPVPKWFIDADRASEPGPVPLGGLTVVAFADNHLVYALTWYALALLAGWGTVRAIRYQPAAASTASGRAST